MINANEARKNTFEYYEKNNSKVKKIKSVTEALNIIEQESLLGHNTLSLDFVLIEDIVKDLELLNFKIFKNLNKSTKTSIRW